MAASSSAVASTSAPSATLALLASPACELISQGAEARVYLYRPAAAGVFPSSAAAPPAPAPLVLKHRFPKTYRHSSLSAHLTAQRTTLEARTLVRCAREGINVPGLRFVDEREGVLAMAWVDGRSIRQCLGGGAEGEEMWEEAAEGEETGLEAPEMSDEQQVALMWLVGEQLALMHAADVIHGDLTTSNMMYRCSDGVDEVVLIDFGLTSASAFAEDKAVDLYVLERAFASTHPASEHLFAEVLKSYAKVAGKKQKGKVAPWKEVERKLSEVRLRGRKRSMVG